MDAPRRGSVLDTTEFNERLFFPRDDVSTPPVGAIDLTVPAPPNVALQVRVHRSTTTPCTLLLFHGNGEVIADYDDVAPVFARAGASLAVMDFRGYGASTGTPTLRAAITDAPLVLRALTAHLNEQGRVGPIVIMGRSLGSACTAELYGSSALPPEVVGFILESGMSDVRALARRRGLALPQEIDPSDRAVFDPIPKLQRGNHPLLVIHGSDDELILPVEAESAFEAAGAKDGEKKLVLIRGHGHNNVSWAPEYWSAIAAFVESLPLSGDQRSLR